ncbi:hypothetical protein [Asanoa siamensis]|uniref:Uncharacterized protein n=1 Tax=Asanoa siamensis TaxID=926357 RepID=A0ABQ4CXU4_9ACTN|nr:hypothetical protein [Asanoa siamensis]GIF75818.1 hypothetical protein Asi02nite_53360 [Asanoa siamensis]
MMLFAASLTALPTRKIIAMPVALSTPARQALIALMLHVTEASNPDLRKLYRVTIDKSARDELSGEKLLTWKKGLRNAIFHELTDLGWARGRQELTLAPPDRGGAAWHLLYGTFRHLDGLMATNGYKLSDVFVGQDHGPRSIEDRIRQAYGKLADEPGAFVSLARLRDELPDIPRKELDEALLVLDQQRAIQLDPDPNRKALSDRAKAAAIPLGGEDMHLITIGSS